jgi:hypothetical protein
VDPSPVGSGVLAGFESGISPPDPDLDLTLATENDQILPVTIFCHLKKKSL